MTNPCPAGVCPSRVGVGKSGKIRCGHVTASDLPFCLYQAPYPLHEKFRSVP